MPRKPANPKTEPAKKTTRKKKDAVETVNENASVVTAEVAETVVVDAPAADTPVKKHGRKAAVKTEETVADTAPVVSEPTAEKPADAPAKKARKPRAKKADTKAEPVLITTLQVGDSEYDITDIAAKAYKAYKSTHKRKVVTEFRVYVKPEEGAAYYTVNGEGDADFKIDI